MESAFRPGRRSFGVAAAAMLAGAALQAWSAMRLLGSIDPATTRVVGAMAGLRAPSEFGMYPSLLDRHVALAGMTALSFAALGTLNLFIAASGSTHTRLLRRLAIVNLAWAVLVGGVCYLRQVATGAVTAAIIALFLLAYLFRSRRAHG